MATACNITGIIGVRNGRAFTYSARKQFWKHDGFLPLSGGDLPVEVFTFGGGASAPLEDGAYFGDARVVSCMTAGADTPVLQLFGNEHFVAMPPLAEDDDSMPAPFFVVVGKTSRSNLSVDENRAFDIDVSQYGAAPQQLVRLRCFYPNATRFSKTPLPSVGKHVVVHGYLTGFTAGRCLIHVVDIALGPGDLSRSPTDMRPAAKLGGFDWKGRKGKRARTDDDLKPEDENESQQTLVSSSASGSQSLPSHSGC